MDDGVNRNEDRTSVKLEVRRRFAHIGDLIRSGNVADLTPEARSWYVSRAEALESFAVDAAADAEHSLTTLGRVL